MIFFIDIIISVISSTQIVCDVICVQYVQKQPPEVFFKKRCSENFLLISGKTPVLESLFNKAAGLKDSYFEDICGRLLLYIIKNNSGVHLNQIWFKCEKDLLEKDTISLILNKTFCPTPLPLIHWRFKHLQRTKTNKTMLSTFPLISFPHKVHNISIEKQVCIPS